ncbi:MAG: hypothetical protein ACYTKD_20490 [Planctomycetota bacterium]|jgi:hypothetical protein
MDELVDDQKREALKRTARVADQMCTAHAVLHDRCYWLALGLDLLLLICAVWLNAMVFVEPAISLRLSPLGIDSKLWLGLLAIAAFFLSVAHVRIGWKSKRNAHAKARAFYASIKTECRHLLSRSKEVDDACFKSLMDRYAFGGEVLVEIPEARFLSLKKRHKLKVLISRYMDRRPGASLLCLRFRLWWRDTRAKLPTVPEDDRNASV